MAPNYRLKGSKRNPGNPPPSHTNMRRERNKRERKARKAGRKFN